MPVVSEKGKGGANFSAYVLFSEGVQFSPSEIRAALLEDYPALELEVGEVSSAFDNQCDTDEFITCPLFVGDRGPDAALTTLIRLPGYGTWDARALRHLQKVQCPDIDERLSRNQSYICISCAASDDTTISAFRAARLASCLAAVFAKLPVALAVYWEQADHFLSPEAVVEMADAAMSDDWPTKQWIGLDIERTDPDGRPLFSAVSFGLEAFKSYEVHYAFAPVPPNEAAQWVMSTAQMALEFGNEFQDGNTIGVEDDADGFKLRIRDYAETTEAGTKRVKMLFHPDCPIDHEDLCGPTPGIEPPAGFDNKVQPNWGFFKRMIRGQRAH